MEFTSRDVPIVLVGKSVMMVTRSDRHMMDTKELDLHTKHEKFEERERWIRKLKHIGYYSANGLTPPDPKEEPVKIPENEKYLLRNLPYALEAMAKLIAANSGLKADFDKIMQKEIDIANTAGSTINPLNASEEEWLILGNKGVQQKISVDTLVKDYSMSEVEATRMVDIASRTLPAKNITADAIIKKVNPTAPTAAAPPTAPTPTPTPPVPAPVTPPAPEEPEVKAELTQAEKIDYLKNIPNCMEAVDILKANGWDVDNALNVVLKTAIEIDVSGASAEDIAGYAGYLVEPTPEAPTPAPMRALSWDKENVDWTKGGKSYKVSQLLSPAFGYPKALVKDMEASGIFKDHPEIKADIENKEAAKKAKKPTASKKKKTEIVNPFQAANFL
jgi:hypothetical protein